MGQEIEKYDLMVFIIRAASKKMGKTKYHDDSNKHVNT